MKKAIKYLLLINFILFFNTNSFAQITKNSPEDIRTQAKILYMGAKKEEAKNHILTIPEQERTAFDYFLTGLASSDEKEAIKAYEASINLDEKYYQSYFNLAQIYYKLQNYEKAIYYYKQSIKYNKDFAYGYYNLGCTNLKTENYNAARKNFESAIKINPQEPDYYFNLGYTYKKLGNTKRADKALKLYNELIEQRNAN